MNYADNWFRKTYRLIFPGWLRKLVAPLKLKIKLLRHDWTYTEEYFLSAIDEAAISSADTIANSLISEFKPVAVVDVGCGTGALLMRFFEKGCRIRGYEYAEAAITLCRKRGIDVVKFDLEKNVIRESLEFDIVISLEVAEHLPMKIAEKYVSILCKLSKIVIFTAAPPGQGGTDHVNEQPPSYWIEKFQAFGFTHLVELSSRMSEEWKSSGNVKWYYYENLMIFRSVS